MTIYPAGGGYVVSYFYGPDKDEEIRFFGEIDEALQFIKDRVLEMEKEIENEC